MTWYRHYLRAFLMRDGTLITDMQIADWNFDLWEGWFDVR